MARRVAFIGTSVALLFSICLPTAQAEPESGAPKAASRKSTGYSLDVVSGEKMMEYRLYRDGEHFMTMVNEAGTFNLRPHPGQDPNGWGSSLYLQPFFPGAVLGHTSTAIMSARDDHIELHVSGGVSSGQKETAGVWKLRLNLRYDSKARSIEGEGVYSVEVPNRITAKTGDLNLYKLASNYLHDVPVLSGGRGETGDMKCAYVFRRSDLFHWIPAKNPSLLVQDLDPRSLTVELVGDYNDVDTKVQGFNVIEPAYKPSVTIKLSSHRNKGGRTPYGILCSYDTGKERDFWSDNVGINLLILRDAPWRRYVFDLHLFSEAPSGDEHAG